MTGTIQKIIKQIIEQRAGTNQILINTTLTKLQLKGIDAKKYTDKSADDPQIIQKLLEIAKQLNTQIKF